MWACAPTFVCVCVRVPDSCACVSACVCQCVCKHVQLNYISLIIFQTDLHFTDYFPNLPTFH